MRRSKANATHGVGGRPFFAGGGGGGGGGGDMMCVRGGVVLVWRPASG